MENSYRFYANKECECYPCHLIDNLNCLFCYCPFYFWDKCPGTPGDFNGVKDCSNCTWPHEPDNYDKAMKLFAHKAEQMRNGDYKGV